MRGLLPSAPIVRTNRSIVRTFVGSLALAVVLVGCEEQNTYVAPPPPKVTVAKPEVQTITDYISLTGTTSASNTVELRARVEGYLEQVLFGDGDRVKEGDLLFVIEKAPYEAAVEEAEAGVERAKAQRDQSQLTAERVGRARKTGAVSQQALDEAKAQEDVDSADVLGRQAALTRAKLDLDYTEVRAPFDGHISRRLKDPGNLVGSDEDTVIAVINQTDPLYVYFTINEEDLLHAMDARKSSPEAAAKARDLPLEMGLADDEGYPLEGTFDYADISLNPSTGTLLLRGTFPNPDSTILAGLFARVRIPLLEKSASILVPEQAIGYDQLGAHVMVVNDENVVERVGVEVGPASGDNRVIRDGLKGDESIIVNGLLRAIPGKAVEPVQQSESAQAGDSKPAS